jgi:hypothetical protein
MWHEISQFSSTKGYSRYSSALHHTHQNEKPSRGLMLSYLGST